MMTDADLLKLTDEKLLGLFGKLQYEFGDLVRQYKTESMKNPADEWVILGTRYQISMQVEKSEVLEKILLSRMCKGLSNKVEPSVECLGTPSKMITIPKSKNIPAFSICTTQVPQKEFESIMGFNPSTFKGYNLPVDSVTWYDTILFCNAKSKAENKKMVYSYKEQKMEGNHCLLLSDIKINPKANGYRLPSEKEWEYAYRAGSTTEYFWGNNPDDADKYAWYSKNSNNTTHPVGTKLPNKFNLYDMTGNVWEWCFDIYAEMECYRVLRGGSWNFNDSSLRSASRYGNYPDGRYYGYVGFRLASRPFEIPSSKKTSKK